MNRPKNKKGKPFSWSYTALTQYDSCPFQYAAARYYCTTPFTESEASIWGNRVHKAAEMLIKGQGPIDAEALAPTERYVTAMIRSGCPIKAEVEVVLTQDFKPVSWFSKDAWFRAKIDVVLEKEKGVISMFDWKTGKTIKDNDDQLRLCAAAHGVLHPTVKRYSGKYIWTAHKQTTGMRELDREGIKEVWQEFLPRVKRMEDAWRTEHFPCKTSGLCRGWCPETTCTHFSPRR